MPLPVDEIQALAPTIVGPRRIRWRIAKRVLAGALAVNFSSSSVAEGLPCLRQANGAPTIVALAQNIPTPEIVAGAKTPSNPSELLQNIKIAMDQHLLRREDFYTNVNLKNFFGAKTVVFGGDFRKQKYAELGGYDNMIQPVKIWPDKPNVMSGISIQVRRIAKEGGLIEGELSLLIFRDGVFPGFDFNQKMFGTNRAAEFALADFDETVRPPTDPHGNDRIEYTGNDGPVHQTIRLSFASDGTLSHFYYVETQ
jgi:hypothetical protein